MKIKICVFFSLVFLFSSQIFCQDTICVEELKKYYNLHYNINNIEYVIFPKCPDSYLTSNKYYTSNIYANYNIVSIDKVLEIDSLAFEFVKKQKTEIYQGSDDCPIIKDNWSNYCRQVICYLKKKGKRKYDEIIEIYYIHKDEIAEIRRIDELYGKTIEDDWEKVWLYVCGGCSFYFHIYYNVNKRKIVDFVVN